MSPLRSKSSTDELLALLERVVVSSQFRRSARLRDLLLYIGRKSILENSGDLKEHDIGVAVFGREDGYDTGQDNIVRVNVTELRKRIETYFLSEGVSEDLVLEIPRGSYSLDFRKRLFTSEVSDSTSQHSSSPAGGHDPAAEDGSPDLPRSQDAVPLSPVSPGANPPELRASVPLRILLLALTVSLACLLIASCWLYWRNRELQDALQPWQSQPTLRLFWKPFLASGQPLDIVLGDTSLALAEDVSRQPVPLNQYVSLTSEHYASDPGLSSDQKRFLSLDLARNNGSFGDFRVARQILSMYPGAASIQIRSAREFSADLLKTRTVILIGSRKSNPWVDLFTQDLDFRLDYDPGRAMSFVNNIHPATGEAARYDAPSDPASSVGYSVIALLPSLQHGKDLVLIAGTDSQATEAAGEFVTSEISLAALQKRVGGSGFPHFQLLLRTSRLRGVPLTAEVVSLHVSNK